MELMMLKRGFLPIWWYLQANLPMVVLTGTYKVRIHLTLYSVQYSVQNTFNIVRCTLYIIKFTPYNVYYTDKCVHYTLTLYSVQRSGRCIMSNIPGYIGDLGNNVHICTRYIIRIPTMTLRIV